MLKHIYFVVEALIFGILITQILPWLIYKAPLFAFCHLSNKMFVVRVYQRSYKRNPIVVSTLPIRLHGYLSVRRLTIYIKCKSKIKIVFIVIQNLICEEQTYLPTCKHGEILNSVYACRVSLKTALKVVHNFFPR